MSYVSLENSESFLKCFEVIAEDKSCIVSDSVLYFSGKTGKGFITAAGINTGIEVLALNVSMLTDDLTIRFQPSPDASSYLLHFDEIEIPVAYAHFMGKCGEASAAVTAHGTFAAIGIVVFHGEIVFLAFVEQH